MPSDAFGSYVCALAPAWGPTLVALWFRLERQWDFQRAGCVALQGFDEQIWVNREIGPRRGLLWWLVIGLAAYQLFFLSALFWLDVTDGGGRFATGPMAGGTTCVVVLPTVLAWVLTITLGLLRAVGHFTGHFLRIGRDGVQSWRVRVPSRSGPEVFASKVRGRALKPVTSVRREAAGTGEMVFWTYTDGQPGAFGPVSAATATDIVEAFERWLALPVPLADHAPDDILSLSRRIRSGNPRGPD